MREHNDPLQSLREAVAVLTDEVRELKGQTRELQPIMREILQGVEFIKAVKVGGRVVKWTAVVLAAIGFIWAAIKGFITQIIIGFAWR